MRQAEAGKLDRDFVRGVVSMPSSARGIDHVRPAGKTVPSRRSKKSKRSYTRTNDMASSCQWCGHQPAHDRQRCPAKNDKCRACGKQGHFQVACGRINKRHSSKVHEIKREGVPFLGEIKDE